MRCPGTKDSVKQCLKEPNYLEVITAQIFLSLNELLSTRVGQTSDFDCPACSDPATPARPGTSRAYDAPALTSCPEGLVTLAVLKLETLIFISTLKPISSVKAVPRSRVITAEAGDEWVISYIIAAKKD